MRRIIFYLFYDREGVVDDYVTYKLAALRQYADHIFVVSNSPLTPSSRSRLNEVADTVWVRENTGFDVGAYHDAMVAVGPELLAQYDELILMNYTFFGPVYPFEPLFARMDALDLDFWGVTSHGPTRLEGPDAPDEVIPRHLQTQWIAVRRSMFMSPVWADYWDDVPARITSYQQSIIQFEGTFTTYFERHGFRWLAAWPDQDYDTDHAAFESAALMLEDQCPVLKRRQFFHESSYIERKAIVGRRVLQALESTPYPTELMWRSVVRAAEPRHLYTNMSLLEILDEVDTGWRPEPPPRIAVLAHLFYEDMVDEVMSYVANIPVPYDLIVTTTSEQKRQVILSRLDGYEMLKHIEVRIVADNRGRDLSALLITCRDVLDSDDYDLVCRVHSKKSPQDGFNMADLFKRHMFDNLLYTPGYVANLLRVFDEQPTLGMVFPPVINIAYPTLGHSWFTNRPLAEKVAKKIGITTLFDADTPVAPYGSMFWARPQALRKMVDYPWDWEDYPDQSGYQDGGLPHVQERLLAYTVLDAGYHVRSVITRDWASINYTFLEWKLQAVAAELPADTTQAQLEFIRQARQGDTLLGALKRTLDSRAPVVGKALRPMYRGTRKGYHTLRGR